MRILIIGGNGTIGKPVADYFSAENEVIIAGRSSGNVQVNIEDGTSIKAMFEKTGKLDAILCIAGEAR